MPPSLSSDEESPPPSPVLEYPKVPLKDLADPPGDWQFLGQTVQAAARARRFPKKRLEVIVNHHSWGINMGLAKRATIEKLLTALWKLFYHMAPSHQPTSFDEIADFSRDAGPRLLSHTVDVAHVPISRYYSRAPTGDKAQSRRFKRPSDAPDSISDSYLEQMSYPVSGGPIDLDASEDEHEEQEEEQEPGQEQEQEQKHALLTENTKSPLRSASTHRSSTSVVNSAPERHVARLLPAKNVVEIVQRIVLKLANADLDRHHTATSAERPCRVASTEQALMKTIERKVPATSQVRIAWNRDTDEMTLHPDGRDYPYRGRGPVGLWNTSSIDCLIVAAKLLDAGSTVLDRGKKEWRAQFTPLEWALITATEVDWDLCFPEQSETLRDHFAQAVRDMLPGTRMQDSIWLQELWNKATANFAQFQFTHYDQFRYCPCSSTNDLGQTTGPWESTFMQLSEVPEDSQGHGTMQARLEWEFAPGVHMDCDACGASNAVTRWRTFETLPARLVTMVDPDTPVTKHTQNLTFEVETFTKRTSVTYRWLGGIYEYQGNFRVFWADNSPGEVDRGEVRMYDGSRNLGMIVGGLSYGHPSERVPYEWWAQKSIPLVFYERVDNVNPQVLSTVMSSVGSMVEAVENKGLLADVVGPWTSSNDILGPTVSDHPGQWVFPSADFFNIEPPVNYIASPLTEQSYPLGMQDSPVPLTGSYSPTPTPPTPHIEDYSPRVDSFPSFPGQESPLRANDTVFEDLQVPDIQDMDTQPDAPPSSVPASELPVVAQQPPPTDAELLQQHGVPYTAANYMSEYYNMALQYWYEMNDPKNKDKALNVPQWHPEKMNRLQTPQKDFDPQAQLHHPSQLQYLQKQQEQWKQQLPQSSSLLGPRSRSSGKGSTAESEPARSASHNSATQKARQPAGPRHAKRQKWKSPDQKNKNRKRKHQRNRKKQANRALAHRQSSRLKTPEGW